MNEPQSVDIGTCTNVRNSPLTSAQLIMVQTRGQLAKVGTHIPPPTKCLLLTLPAELRIRIYEYAMPTCPNSIIFIRKNGIQQKYKPGSLIFTCRQIKDEALAVFFKINTFEFSPHWLQVPLKTPCDRICRGLIGRNLFATKTIEIATDIHRTLRIDLSHGLENRKFSVTRPVYEVCAEPFKLFIKLLTGLRRLFDSLVAEATEQGTTAVLDGYGLIAVMQLLTDTELVGDLRFRLRVPLVATKEVSSRAWT